ncbi:UDP-N-acetylmuramoylalanine--D-glutamate ligase [Alkalibacterium putridalgicola]|uniref:UDP-N-acetylmuramoylalanine--D-glutamate ligase n=1 Tax=Alkalibacterium putridalgicola TaxID=426703 RepID=A0A1H7VUK9_9LACT|nr:UDP-N-acetylmuramoyl-L-alanine--D-glutamate ligase [Alkalibacterium putridalgicola]GEK89887.1 UDP-N-acetylmuramoylalanine--D-glutamate ligase [Alkalibacterium putridalgicola]SEM12505.1 UDP-N-acetylmuramoylalanine--D-glutamate ligase [Alkalibacterium putridalgicola]
MKNEDYFKNKTVLVLGLAVSGYNAALLLDQLGSKVIVNDFKDLSENEEAQILKAKGIEVISGGHPLDILDRSLDFIVKNPGIPYSNPLVKQAVNKKIKIVTEVELAYLISESPMIAITGTNGKTTTTMMIENLLNENRSKGKAYAVGNIGTPASLVAQESSVNDDLVMEVSSFQLMGVDKFHPSIAVITNIYSAHLDYHKTRDEYVNAKLAITENQTDSDYIVFNRDQEELTDLVTSTSAAKLVPFSRKKELGKGAYVKDKMIMFNGEEVMSTDKVLIPGEHNLENALAAVAVAKLKGIDNKDIEAAFGHFQGVKHRMQLVDTVDGRKFYNDSKATNSLATIHALEGFSDPVVLVAGGLDRQESLDDLIPLLKEHVKAVVTFGETKHQLAEVARKADISTIIVVDTVSEATRQAFGTSEKKDVILLSPACASWDQYANFEERGNDFIQTVQEIDQSVKGG